MLYPTTAKDLMQKLDGGMNHFIYKEDLSK